MTGAQVQIDQTLCGAGDVPRRPVHAQRLGRDLRAFHQQKQLVSQEPRLRDAYADADLHQPAAQLRFVRLDHFSRGMILLGNLDGRVRDGAAASGGVRDVLGEQTECGVDLPAGSLGYRLAIASTSSRISRRARAAIRPPARPWRGKKKKKKKK